MEKSIKSNSVDYGLYLGGALSVYTILCYGISMETLVNYWVMLLIMPIVIITAGVFSIRKAKSINNGYLSFKEAFSAYFITVAIALMISTLVSIILFNFVDPEAALTLKEVIIEKTLATMESFNTPVEIMSEEIDKLKSQDTFGFPTQLRNLAQSLATFAIIGLIVAAIMKKPNKSEDSL